MKKFKDWIPAITIMMIIFALSSLPGPAVDAAGLNKYSLQVSSHLILHMLLTIAYYKATKNIPLSILLTVLYAITDEAHQMFTLLRSPSLFDIYVDSLGSLISGLFLWKLLPTLPKKLKIWLND
ncbi:MAG: VanZ family protein [Patescibacteria group bacterium]|nr:VanZ family protein [Patescibacteria group bacterium]